MTTLNHPTRISREELREWAYDPDPTLPENADADVWTLMLLDWYADVRLYVDLVADSSCPKRRYFLVLLRQGLRRKVQGRRGSPKPPTVSSAVCRRVTQALASERVEGRRRSAPFGSDA